MDEIMLWIETNLTYENMVAAANVLATISIGAAFIYNKIKQTKMTLLKNTDIVNNVNKTIQPILGGVVNQSLKGVLAKMEKLEIDNRRLMEATILAMTNDAQSRLAAIKLLSESSSVSKTVSYEAEKMVVEEIKVETVAEKEAEQTQAVVEEKVQEMIETL
jgi:hypothetical protein